jgi:WD40 repeat protein/predicted Ser/Thr protein kinase
MSEAGDPGAALSGVPPLARRLEELWRSGHRPDLDQFLAGAGPVAPAELAAVLGIDQWHRWHAGERVPAEAYLRRYPALEAEAEPALELVYGEFLVREELGEGPTAGEYLQRFPRHADQLRAQFQLHQGLDRATDHFAAGPGGNASATVCQPPGGPPPAAPAGAAPWPSVAGYEVLGELGRGGMGVVFKARQRGLNRLVALKFLRWGADASPEERARFRREAEAVARLQHANVVQVHEVGEQDGRPFLALEFLEGGSLARQLDGTPRPARPAAQLIAALARAVHAAHRLNIVHRDLKPDNVLLTADGTPKVADFGLAKLLDRTQSQTDSGAVLGTPSYMSPEQARGQSRAIGPATDVYALGALLYELVTGRPPFRGETAVDTVMQVVAGEPVRPSQLNPRLPRDLETVCLKCLQKEPAKRYASAEDLAEDLGRFLAGRPVAARPVGMLGRGWRWCRRNPRGAALLGAVFGLLTVIAAGTSLGVVRLNTLLGRAQDAERETQEKLFESYVEKARALRRSQRLGQRFNCLDTIVQARELARQLKLPAERFHELRNEATAALALLDLRPKREWVGNTGSGIAFDADLERYARCDTTGGVSVRRVAGDVKLLRLPAFGVSDNYFPSFSPDGRHLSVWQEYGGRIKVWRLDRDPPVLIRDVPTEDQSVPAFSPDGRSLAYALPDGTVELIDLESGGVRRLPAAEGARGGAWFGLAVAWHPDSRRFALATKVGSRSVVQVRARDSGQVLATLTGARQAFFHPVWHPGGRLLAVADGLEVRLWDMVAGTWTAELFATQNGGTRLAFTPAGDLLVTTDWDGVTRFWEPHSGLLVFKADTRLATVQFSRDGRYLAGGVWDTITRKLRVWEVPRRCYRRLRPLPAVKGQGCWGVAVSPGDRLLAASFGTGVGLWDLPSGQQLVTVPGIGRDTMGLAFDGAGALWTFGDSGLWRWPVKPPQAGPGQIGPPLSFATDPRGDREPISTDRQGRVLALRNQTGQWALHVGPPPRGVRLGADGRDGRPWVNPDGRWVALGDSAGQKVRLLDAATGQRIRDLPLEGCAGVCGGSPDGRWLVALDSKSRFRLWRTDTWEPSAPVTGNAFGFPPDSRLLAVETGEGRIRLLDPTSTDRELAALEDPHQDLVSCMTFTRDGTRLITVSWRETPALHVWDLVLLREQLAELGLDWEQDPYPPAPPAPPGPPPQYVVDCGRLPPEPQAGLVLYSLAIALQPLNPAAYEARFSLAWQLGERRLARADLEKLIALQVAKPLTLNSLAWELVAGPPEQRDPPRALALARRAVEAEPENELYVNTLGVALYRAGKYREAQAALEKSLRLSQGKSDAFDLYFLAMCYHRLGDAARARACLDQAVAWRKAHPDLPPQWPEELDAFQVEADGVLGPRPP